MDVLPSDAEIVAGGVSLLIKVSVVLLAAWLFSVALRRRPAGLRHLLWSLAVGAVVALPLISPWMPTVEVAVPQIEAISFRLLAVQDVAPEDPAGLTTAPDDTAQAAPVQVSSDDAEAPAPVTSRRPERPSFYLLIVWLGGAALLLTVFLVDLVRIWRTTRGAISKARFEAMSTEVAAGVGLSRGPRVLLGRVELPLTWGLTRPVVLLPIEAAGWSDRKLRIVLLHELAHIRRLDYLPHVLAEISCILYWPNPLVWIARYKLRREQEQACDDAVLRRGTSSHDYAEMLLDIARDVHRRRLLPGGVSMAERKGLKERIHAILDPTIERSSASSLAVAVILVSVAVPAFSTAALQPAGTDRTADGPAREVSDVSTGETTTTDRIEVSMTEQQERRAFTLTVEAESGRLTPPMERREDDGASGGAYAMVPDQDGHDPPEGGPGRVRLDVDLRGVHGRAVWARVIGDRHNDNSFFVSVDDKPEFRWDVLSPDGRNAVKDWTWLPVVDRSGRPLRLDPGTHTLTFRNREDGTRLDAVFVTGDEALIPRGGSEPAPPEATVSVAVEAERPAELAAPMEIRSDDEASDRLFVTVADGFDSRRRVPEDGRVAYRIDAPKDGRYVVWARVMAQDDDEDSFWIRVNRQRWIRWNDIEEDDDWSWRLVRDSDEDGELAVFSLSGGANLIEIAYREDGAGIDRFVVTNNAYAHPAGANTSDVAVTFTD